MITIVKAKIKNYRSIGEIELNIDGQGLVSVLGANLDDPLSPSNGVGKSTILSSFKWGLFGVSTDGDKADDILSWTNPKDCSVEMTILKDGQLAEIARYRKHKQHGNNVYFYIDKQPVNAAKNKDIQPLIDAYLGFDENIFSILLTMGSLSKNAEPFMYMNDSGRKEFTDFLLNLSYLSVCLKEVKADIDIAEDKIKTITEDTTKKTILADSLRTKIEEYSSLSDSWKTAHAECIKNNTEAVAQTVRLLADAKVEVEKAEGVLTAKKQEKATADTRSTELQVAISNKRRDAEKIDNELFLNQTAIDDCLKKIAHTPQYPRPDDIVCKTYDETILQLHTKYTDVSKQVEILANKKSNLISNKAIFLNALSPETSAKLEEVRTKIKDLQIKTGVLQSEKKNIKKDHDEIKDFLDTGNLKCPKCRQGVDKTHLTSELNECKNAHNLKVDEIKATADAIIVLTSEENVILSQSLIENTARFDNDIKDIEREAITLSEQLTNAHADIIKAQTARSAETALLQKAQRDENDKAEKLRVDELTLSLNTLAETKEKLLMSKVKAESECTSVQMELKAYRDSILGLIEGVENAEKAVKATNNTVSNLESTLKYHVKQLDDEKKKENPYTDLINKNVLMLNEQSAIIKDNGAKLATLRQEAEYLYFWCEGFNTAGLKSYILDSVTALLDTKANDCLSKLSSSLAVKFVTQEVLKSGDIRDKFDVNIYNNSNKTQFYRLSAGQKARVSFAVNYALKILAEYYHNIKINFTFIDEALDNLDSVGIQQVIHNLREQLQQYTSIFVVSHNDELKSLFDKTLLLLYENGVTRLDD